MAELTNPVPVDLSSACCTPAAQETCCPDDALRETVRSR